MTTTEEPLTVKTTAPAEPALAPAAGREYVVLQAVLASENQWADIGIYAAMSTDGAIKKAAAVQAADPDIDTTGVLTYVAVPSRSFQPVELTARVEPKIEFRGR